MGQRHRCGQRPAPGFGLATRRAGERHTIALWPANSPVWIIAALAVLAAGAMLLPIDELADLREFERGLKRSRARLLITTTRHLEECRVVLRATGAGAVLLDDCRPRVSRSDARQPQALTVAPGSAVGAGLVSWRR
jgi:long-subunit acyl-CoA synthetase (AMP-forming)